MFVNFANSIIYKKLVIKRYRNKPVNYKYQKR